MRPKLTIAIPTFNRPGMLPNALRAAVGQTRPCGIIVTDNGDPGPTREILSSPEFAGAPIRYIETQEPGAWPNWRAAALACETEYFAWLQDDDVVRGTYAERIVDVMDYFPDANVWLARLACAYSSELGMPFKGNCPWLPMDMLNGKPSQWMGGDIVAATSYLTSWSLNPAQAYRVNDRFFEALHAMPEHAEIFIERLFPSWLSAGSPIVADPIVAGYWVQHTRMLHLSQNIDPVEREQQLNNSFACLDKIMDRIESSGTDWAAMVRNWVKWIPLDTLKGWIENLEKLPEEIIRGRYLDRVMSVAGMDISTERTRRQAPEMAVIA